MIVHIIKPALISNNLIAILNFTWHLFIKIKLIKAQLASGDLERLTKIIKSKSYKFLGITFFVANNLYNFMYIDNLCGIEGN